MITKPYVASSHQSVAAPGGGELVSQLSGAEATGDLSVDCTSLFIYDSVDRQHTSTGVDVKYYDCASDDSGVRPTELLYAPSHHGSQLHHAPQQPQSQRQQACTGGDGDEDGAAVKLHLLAGCGKATLEYPWMRDKKSAADAMCLAASMSDRRLKQYLTSDPLTQTPGPSILG